MHALVSSSGPVPGPGPLTVAGTSSALDVAAEAFLVLLVVAALLAMVWFFRPLLRVRHARLPGATPEETLLMSGRGRAPAPPPPVEATAGAAVSVLPSRAPVEEAPLELGDEDRTLVDALGRGHPMSAPGRHRPAPGDGSVGVPDAETLLTPRPGSPAEVRTTLLGPDALRSDGPGPEWSDGNAVAAPVDWSPASRDQADVLPVDDKVLGDAVRGDAVPGDAVPGDAVRGDAVWGGEVRWGGVELSEARADTRPIEGLPIEGPRDHGAVGLEATVLDEAVSITARKALEAEGGHMTGSPTGRANDFYGIDWQDDEWSGVTLPRGEDAAGTTKWWADVPSSPDVPAASAVGVTPGPGLRPLSAVLPAESPAPVPPLIGAPSAPVSAPASARSGSAGRGWDDLVDVSLDGAGAAPALLPVALAPEGGRYPAQTPPLPLVDLPLVPLQDDTDPGGTGPSPLFAVVGDDVQAAAPGVADLSWGPDQQVPVEQVPVEQVPVEGVDGQCAEDSAEDSTVPGPRPSGQLSAAERNALQETGERLDGAHDRVTVARTVTAAARDLVAADSVALVVHGTDGPWALAVTPDAAPLWGPQTLAALISAGGPVRRVVEGDPLLDGAASALLAVPMASAGAWVGTLLARRESPRPFTAAEQGLLDRFARMAGAALDGLTRRGVLRREGGVDPLTSLAPPHRLVPDLQASLRGGDVHGMPVSLVVAEIDGLARLRTEAGQERADEAMVLIAHTMATRLRVGDVPYRFDEDVLAVLMAATEAEDAAVVAARLADQVDEVTDATLGLARPLRLRTVVIAVTGTAQDILDEAERALAEQRVHSRWLQ